MTNRQLDLFTLLNNIDRKNIGYIDTLTKEELKEFQPFVIMRWLSGTTNKFQIIALNEFVNPYVFNFSEHKKLLYYLMTTCSDSVNKHSWNGGLLKNNQKLPLTIEVIQNYYNYSFKEAKNVLSLLSNEDILYCAEQLGYQKETLDKVKKELKDRQNGCLKT